MGEGVTFQAVAVVLQVVEDVWLQAHKASVDPALTGLRLLRELGNEVALEAQGAEASRRPDGGQRGDAPVLAVEAKQLVQVPVANTIPVGQHEGAVLEPRLETLDTAAGLRLLAGVDQMNDPVLHI